MGNNNHMYKWLVLIPLLLAACNTPPKVVPGASSAVLESTTEHTRKAVTEIIANAESIRDNASSIRAGLQELEAHQIGYEMDSKAQNIINGANRIEEEIKTLEGISTEVAQLEQNLQELNGALASKQAEALEKLYGYITTFWAIGFVLIIAGAGVAFFLNKTYGGSLALLGVLMLGFASAAHKYLDEIALVGGIILVLSFLTAVGLMVVSSLKNKHMDLALKEIVETLEVFKQGVTEEESNKLFGPEGIANKVQSPFTKKVIAQIREKNGFVKLKEITDAHNV